MANLAQGSSPARRFGLLISGLSAALVIGGGLVVLLFFLALGFANWVRSQPEPAVFLLGSAQFLTHGDNRAVPSGRAPHLVDRDAVLGIVYRIIFPPWRNRLLDN